MRSVPDLRSYLSGTWRIDRVILDRRRAIDGAYVGTGVFSPEGLSLQYFEQGRLTFAGHEGPAEQSHTYAFPLGPARAFVHFRDGRAFHVLDLSAGNAEAVHRCEPDLYEGRFVSLDDWKWSSTWKVTGPRKDQEIRTMFTRMA